VAFNIDANGILHVTAKDLGTGKEAKIEIKGSSGLDQAEVERMRKEAESHAAETKKRVELINARNEADAVVFQMEKLLKENEGKISEGDKAPIRSAMDRVKEAAKGEDVGAIKQAVENLHQASHAMAQHLYGQRPTAGTGGPDGGAAPGGAAPGGKEEDVQDAEFEVKK
jgi:molecular chaperone DnaK